MKRKWEYSGKRLNVSSQARSEDMELYQMTMANDDAWYIMNQLGNLGTIHMIDLNKHEQPFQLPFAKQIRRAEDALTKIT